MRKIKLFTPNSFTEEWIEGLRKTFESGQLAQGPKVAEFEEEFCREFWYDHATAVNSGTSALEIAYHLVGIGPGDKVLVPVLTCSATNIPLVRRKANIVFCDITKDTWTIDYESVKENIKGAKCLVTVNLGGVECDDRVYELAEKEGVPVVVDAAQSLGITEFYGNYVCYSFQAIKHFTTGDGGMVITRNPDNEARARKLRWFGIDRDRRQKMNFNFSPSNREMCMNMDEAGYKCEMNSIDATMGLVGLKHWQEDLMFRRELKLEYVKNLNHEIPIVAGGSCWLFGIMLEGRDEGKMDKIKEAGVECDLVHLRNDIFTPFGGKRLDLPNMNYVEKRYLYLPIHTRMTKEDVQYVCEVVNGTTK
jgi:dTDP-4-amino-4,6-dideoxygalactose transaminase